LLLCEDNHADVLLVKRALEVYDVPAQMDVVTTGDDAVAFIERAEQDPEAPRPELVLLDLNLPNLNGLEVLKYIRKSGKCRDIPVVIFTSSDSPVDRLRTAELGATRYFRKPIKYQDYLEIGQILKELLASRG
jgi:CheY-like chemotaxis protein